VIVAEEPTSSVLRRLGRKWSWADGRRVGRPRLRHDGPFLGAAGWPVLARRAHPSGRRAPPPPSARAGRACAGGSRRAGARVCSLTTSRSAIWRFVSPSASRRSTSLSRGVSASRGRWSPAARRRRARPASSSAPSPCRRSRAAAASCAASSARPSGDQAGPPARGAPARPRMVHRRARTRSSSHQAAELSPSSASGVSSTASAASKRSRACVQWASRSALQPSVASLTTRHCPARAAAGATVR
jgi:hypothetical protein